MMSWMIFLVLPTRLLTSSFVIVCCHRILACSDTSHLAIQQPLHAKLMLVGITATSILSKLTCTLTQLNRSSNDYQTKQGCGQLHGIT